MPLIKFFVRTGVLALPFFIYRDINQAQESQKPKEEHEWSMNWIIWILYYAMVDVSTKYPLPNTHSQRLNYKIIWLFPSGDKPESGDEVELCYIQSANHNKSQYWIMIGN